MNGRSKHSKRASTRGDPENPRRLPDDRGAVPQNEQREPRQRLEPVPDSDARSALRDALESSIETLWFSRGPSYGPRAKNPVPLQAAPLSNTDPSYELCEALP
jgi:hypothetical protein